MSDYVSIRESLLDKDKLALKRQWDAEWEAESAIRAGEYYPRKKLGLTTAQEDTEFSQAEATRWEAEKQRRISAGLYREITKAELESRRVLLQAEIISLDARIKAME